MLKLQNVFVYVVCTGRIPFVTERWNAIVFGETQVQNTDLAVELVFSPVQTAFACNLAVGS